MLDVVLADTFEPFAWYKNVSVSPIEYELGVIEGVSPAFTFANADFDLDGDLDMLISNGDLWWYENIMEQVLVINISENIDLTIYPNPTQDFIYLKNIEPGKYKYEIVDLTGHLISKNIVANHA